MKSYNRNPSQKKILNKPPPYLTDKNILPGSDNDNDEPVVCLPNILYREQNYFPCFITFIIPTKEPHP